MIIEFSSEVVEILVENETLVIAFTDNHEVFMIQYSMCENEDQKVYFERYDQNNSCWDEIENLVVTKNSLIVTFTTNGASKIGCNEIKIEFSIENNKQKELQEKLQFIFENKKYAKINIV